MSTFITAGQRLADDYGWGFGVLWPVFWTLFGIFLGLHGTWSFLVAFWATTLVLVTVAYVLHLIDVAKDN